MLRQNLNAAAGSAEPAAADNSQFQNVWMSYPLSQASLRSGTNMLAVEVHRYSRSEEDLSFDLQLTSGDGILGQALSGQKADFSPQQREVSVWHGTA